MISSSKRETVHPVPQTPSITSESKLFFTVKFRYLCIKLVEKCLHWYMLQWTLAWVFTWLVSVYTNNGCIKTLRILHESGSHWTHNYKQVLYKKYVSSNSFLCCTKWTQITKSHLSTCQDLINKANLLQNIFLELTKR